MEHEDTQKKTLSLSKKVPQSNNTISRGVPNHSPGALPSTGADVILEALPQELQELELRVKADSKPLRREAAFPDNLPPAEPTTK